WRSLLTSRRRSRLSSGVSAVSSGMVGQPPFGSHGPVLDRAWPLALLEGLLHLGQGQFHAEAVARGALDLHVLLEQLRVVLAGQQQGGAGREDAEAAAQAWHTEVVRPVVRHPAGTDAVPHLLDSPAVDGQPVVHKAQTVGRLLVDREGA